MSSETERITNEFLNRHDFEGVIERPARANLQAVAGRHFATNNASFADRRRGEAETSTRDGHPDFLSRILGWILTRPSRIPDAE